MNQMRSRHKANLKLGIVAALLALSTSKASAEELLPMYSIDVRLDIPEAVESTDGPPLADEEAEALIPHLPEESYPSPSDDSQSTPAVSVPQLQDPLPVYAPAAIPPSPVYPTDVEAYLPVEDAVAVVDENVAVPAAEPPAVDEALTSTDSDDSGEAKGPAGACFIFDKADAAARTNYAKLLESVKKKVVKGVTTNELQDHLNIFNVSCRMSIETECRVVVRGGIGTMKVAMWHKDLTCVQAEFDAYIIKNKTGSNIEIQRMATTDILPDDFNGLDFGNRAIPLKNESIDVHVLRIVDSKRHRFVGAHIAESGDYRDLLFAQMMPAENAGIVRLIGALRTDNIIGKDKKPVDPNSSSGLIIRLNELITAYVRKYIKDVHAGKLPATANNKAKPYENLNFVSFQLEPLVKKGMSWECVDKADVRMKNTAGVTFLSDFKDSASERRFAGLRNEVSKLSHVLPRDCLRLARKNKTAAIARRVPAPVAPKAPKRTGARQPSAKVQPIAIRRGGRS